MKTDRFKRNQLRKKAEQNAIKYSSSLRDINHEELSEGAFPICQRASNESGVIASHSVQRFGHRSH